MKRLVTLACASALALVVTPAAHAITITPAQIRVGTNGITFSTPLLSISCFVSMTLHILNPIPLDLPRLPIGWVDEVRFEDCDPGWSVAALYRTVLGSTEGWPLAFTELLGTLPDAISGAKLTMLLTFRLTFRTTVVCIVEGELAYLYEQNQRLKQLTANSLPGSCGGAVRFGSGATAMSLDQRVVIS